MDASLTPIRRNWSCRYGPDMTDWSEFENLGEEEVRSYLALQRWGGTPRAEMARQWLEIQASKRAAEGLAGLVEETRSANDLAREANQVASEANSIARAASASAKRTADAARNSNIMAALALALAIMSAIISAIALRH